MLKLGITLPNLANKCLHKSTNYRFYPFCENDKDLCEKIREYVTVGPSFVFTRNVLFDETIIRKLLNICKSIVGIDASQLYSSQCVNICPQVCTRDGSLTPICRILKLDIIELTTLRPLLCFLTRKQDQYVKLKAFLRLENRRKIDCFNVDGYCDHPKTVFAAMRWYYHFYSFEEARPSVTDQDIERGNKKREMDDMRRESIKEIGYKVEEMWKSVTGEKVSKSMTKSKITSEPIFPIKDFFLQTH